MSELNLRELLLDAGYEPTNYSGRAMYSKECLGVETDEGNAARVVLEVVQQAIRDLRGEPDLGDKINDLCDTLMGCSMDSMGLGYIIYWRGIEWDGPEEDEDEDE